MAWSWPRLTRQVMKDGSTERKNNQLVVLKMRKGEDWRKACRHIRPQWSDRQLLRLSGRHSMTLAPPVRWWRLFASGS